MQNVGTTIGDLYPVWWWTGIEVDGRHHATILDIKPYNGIFKEHYNSILVLTAPYPSSKKGSLEMTAKI